jgi:hypothetical protein
MQHYCAVAEPDDACGFWISMEAPQPEPEP